MRNMAPKMTRKTPRAKARKTARKTTGVAALRQIRPHLSRALDTAARSDETQVRQLLHELHLHSEEMTAQNEQLVKAQSELEHARDRYADLFDFAPVGYMQVDSRSTIVDINLAGADLLGRMRSFIINMPVSTMFVNEHLLAVREFLLAARVQTDNAVRQTEARVRRHPERVLRLAARPLGVGTASGLLVALLDVTEERRLEAERVAALEREQSRAADLVQALAAGRAAEERVKALAQRLVSVQEQERRRIARNLHDHLGQQLTALRLTIAAAKDSIMSPDQLRERLDAIERIAAGVDQDVDLIAWDLRPAALDDVGLHAALETLVGEWSETRKVAADFHVSEPDAIRLGSDVESHLYRIVQEALNNVGKHADATHVSVLLERRGHDIVAIVEDNGKGFDFEAARHKPERGMGLASMQERAALVGGEMQVESAPGEGTTLFIRMPVHPAIQGRIARKQAKMPGA